MDKLTLNTISDPKSRSEKKRVGRGAGSGVGKTAGKRDIFLTCSYTVWPTSRRNAG